MANFVLILVNIMYALVCWEKDSEQGNGSTSKPAEDNSKKEAEG